MHHQLPKNENPNSSLKIKIGGSKSTAIITSYYFFIQIKWRQKQKEVGIKILTVCAVDIDLSN